MTLVDSKCEPCSGNTPGLNSQEIQEHLKQLDGWNLRDGSIEKVFKFSKYLEGLEFVYKIGKLAESEGHHPDILLEYKLVRVFLKTHAINALSKNDFILAAKIDEIKLDEK